MHYSARTLKKLAKSTWQGEPAFTFSYKRHLNNLVAPAAPGRLAEQQSLYAWDASRYRFACSLLLKAGVSFGPVPLAIEPDHF